MFLAIVGQSTRRSWPVAILFAVGLELAMLFTPYPSVFGIAMRPAFVVVTLLAHLVFGVAMGLTALWLCRRWPIEPRIAARSAI
jgi:hypothetical protein